MSSPDFSLLNLEALRISMINITDIIGRYVWSAV